MEIETLLKSHTDNVADALKGFEGKMASQADLIATLTAQATAIERKIARPGAGADEMGFASKVFSTGQARFPASELKTMEDILRGKAMSGLTDPDGGFQIPEIISTQIESLVLRQSPIRQLAKVINLPGRVTRLPINVRGATGGWLAETAARTETTTPQFNEVTPTGGTIYAVPKVSEELVDDAVANIEQFVTDNVVDCLAEMESIAFIGGDGVNKPTGFLSGTPVATADASRAFGTLQYVASGNATTLGTTPNDTLIAMVLSMKAGYRQSPGCAWVMSTAALSVIAQLKDTQGRPLFIPSLREGIPGMLFGYPVVECEHMAAIGAGAFPIAFGNWQRGYVIGDRTQLSILRDPFTQKGFILWYFRRRTYGNILNSEAIKLLKVAVS